MNAIRNPDQTLLSDPYLAADGAFQVYVTFSRHMAVGGGGRDAVSAVDINMNWSVYNLILEDIEFLDHYFIVDLKENVIMHSKMNMAGKSLSKISQVEFSGDNSVDVCKLDTGILMEEC